MAVWLSLFGVAAISDLCFFEQPVVRQTVARKIKAIQTEIAGNLSREDITDYYHRKANNQLPKRVVGWLKLNMVAARAPAGEILVLNFLAIL